jgi:hypothetical protein
MKKIFCLIICVFAGSFVFGQSPARMSYQAVIRNSSNNLVTASPVGMRISILQGSASGPAEYVETQLPTSNANGLVTVEIGGGTLVSGDFTNINWSNGPYFIKTETDPTGGSTYTITGTSQLLSVPYAFYAKTAETAANIPTNVSSFANDAGYLTSEVDGSTTNELQTISRTGTTVTLSNGGGSYTDSMNVYTAGSGINITGNTISSTTTIVGDVKQGFQSGDHNGWYLLDGRLLSTLPVIAQSNASLLGITVNLPNATNRFLADMGANGSTGGSNSISLAQTNLPNLTLTGTAASNGAHTHTVDPVATTTTTDGAHNHDFHTANQDFNGASSQGWPTADQHVAFRTTDRNQRTENFGTIVANGDHTHTVDIALTTSSSNGAHTHSVTVSTGGSGTAINSTPAYLSVNAFIYLGQ